MSKAHEILSFFISVCDIHGQDVQESVLFSNLRVASLLFVDDMFLLASLVCVLHQASKRFAAKWLVSICKFESRVLGQKNIDCPLWVEPWTPTPSRGVLSLRSCAQVMEMSFLQRIAWLSFVGAPSRAAAPSLLKETAEVVRRSDQDAPWAPPLWRFSRYDQQGGDPGAVPELAGGIIYLICPRTSGEPA